MSTKIYNGIILDNVDIWTLKKDIQEIIEHTFYTENKKFTAEKIAISYAQQAAYKALGKETTKNGVYLDALNTYKNDKKEGYINFLQCTVYIFPPLDNGKTLGYIATNNENYVDNILELPYVHEFGYWNNTDKPSHVTDEEWEERSLLWNQQLDTSFFFFNNAISITRASIDEEIFEMPNEGLFDDLNTHMKNTIATTFAITYVLDSPEIIEKLKNTQNFMHIFMQVSRYMRDCDDTGVLDIPTFTSDSIMSNNIILPTIDVSVLDNHKKIILDKFANNA